MFLMKFRIKVAKYVVLRAELLLQVHQKRRGVSPPFFYGDAMKKLSIFVDESGDFSAYSKHSTFYLFSLVLHEQNNSINDEVIKLFFVRC